MKALSKADQKKFDELKKKLNEAKDLLEIGLDTYAAKTTRTFDEVVVPKLKKFNELVAEANGFIEAMKSALEEEFDGMSEKWQVSDNGSAFSDWKDQWDIELDEIELDAPDEDAEETMAPEIVEEFENLPAEME